MKKISLSIPKPCHENWDAMTPEDKGRFCGSCQKMVIDFSNMSDRQMAEFFKKPAGTVCGRFANDQLNRTIEMPRKRIPWVRHFFTIALPAFLVSLKAGAQKDERTKGRVVVCQKPAIKVDTLKPTEKPEVKNMPVTLGMVLPKPTEEFIQDTITIISGRVTDENGNPLPGASIHLSNTKQGTVTDNYGNFSLKLEQHSGVLRITYVGYESTGVSFKGESFLTIAMKEDRRELMGELIVMPVKKKKPVPLIPSQNIDTAFSKFSVYPNPAASGATITIQPKNLEEGRYIASILSSAGEVVQAKELLIDRKTRQLNLWLDEVAAGAYFIRLTNKSSAKSYTEIILIEN